MLSQKNVECPGLSSQLTKRDENKVLPNVTLARNGNQNVFFFTMKLEAQLLWKHVYRGSILVLLIIMIDLLIYIN